MEPSLFKVTSSKSYKPTFCFAYGYDQAANKVLNHLLEEQEREEEKRELTDREGSMTAFLFDSKKEREEIRITQVELITDTILK